MDAFAGISNSGYSPALPVVSPFLTGTDPVLRTAAIQAIRLMDHADVDALLVARLGEDSDADVRVAAVQALGNRKASTALGVALSERALRDENPKVRMRALQLAIRWRDELPELRQTVQAVAEREGDAAIRGLAAGELILSGKSP